MRILTFAHWYREAEQQLIKEALLLLLASIFVFISAVTLSLASEGSLQWSHLYAPLGWFVTIIFAFFVLHRSQPQHDQYLLPLVALMSGWGLILIDRLAPNFLNRQLIWTVVGIFTLVLSANFPRDLGWLYRYRYTWLLAGLLLLAATLWFGVNPSGQGATLWLKVPLLGSVFFQPSELLKLLLVIFLASYFDDRSRMLSVRIGNGWRPALAYLAPLLLMWGFCLVLLVWQQDLGAATLFFTVFLVLLYLATGKWQYILLGLILLLFVGLIGYFSFELVALRIETWLNPWIEADSRGFQIVQSLYAVASGGIFGQGVSQGFPTYIPVVHSDFAFAAIAEEWGLIGSLTILCCFAILAYRGIRIASKSNRLFNLFLAAGITVVLCTQALLIMAGVTKLLPLTGVTLPFVSYGGSSFVMSSLMIGLLLNLSTRQKTKSVKWRWDRKSFNWVIRMSFRTDINAVKSRLIYFQLVAMAGFVLVAIALIYWSIVSGPEILARDDNPRLVEEELSIHRGSILDANNVTLAESLLQEDVLRRHYPVEGMGPVVGYYSLRHGTSGIESSFDPLLRGDIQDFWTDFWRRTQHQNQVGRDIQLTIDARLQQISNSLIGNEKGAVLLFSIPESEIKAMVSSPSFDPNELDEQFDELVVDEEAPLLNRVTQGQYQPGMVLQPFIIATALGNGIISMEQTVEGADEAIVVNGTNLQCKKPVNIQATWREVLESQCPAAMIQLANRLGKAGLLEVFSKFGFTVAPNLEIDTDVGDNLTISNAEMAAIGQDDLSVSPLQVGLALATLANEGELPNPQLVMAVEDLGDQWVQMDSQPSTAQIIDAETTQELLETFTRQNGIGEYSNLVLSGPEGTTNAWYLGLIPGDSPEYGIVVVIEDAEDVSIAEQIGRKVLGAAQELAG